MDLFYFCRISSGRRQRQLNTCFQGHMVAFDLDEFHRVDGRGNWIPASKVIWLPLNLASFIGSMAEATEYLLVRSYGCLWSWRISSGRRQKQLNSCFQGHMVAFDPREFHRVDGRGNWIPASKVIWLPLTLASFIGSMAEATEFLPPRSHGCLWPWRVSSGRWQRQLNSCLWGHMVALASFIGSMAEAAKQGEIQRMAASWKTSKMGSRQFIILARWVPDNSYYRNKLFT